MSESTDKEVAPPLSQGRYRLVEVLGTGGMATVYRAYDRRLDVDRAIKVLTPGYASNAELRKRFLAEARMLARLHHPNIVMAHDIGSDGERIYIVMELVEGGSVWDRMRESGELPPLVALDVVEALLSALTLAHEQGVIHRDIKPGNILVTKDGSYKLADFGIARAAQGDPSNTRTGSMLGTPSYMAPEQWAAGKEIDARADIFSMGATLYSLVTMTTPQDIHIPELQDEQLAEVNPVIATLIRRAVRYRANERYGSAVEMLAACQDARRQLTHVSGNQAPKRVEFEPQPIRSSELLLLSNTNPMASEQSSSTLIPIPELASSPVSLARGENSGDTNSIPESTRLHWDTPSQGMRRVSMDGTAIAQRASPDRVSPDRVSPDRVSPDGSTDLIRRTDLEHMASYPVIGAADSGAAMEGRRPLLVWALGAAVLLMLAVAIAAALTHNLKQPEPDGPTTAATTTPPPHTTPDTNPKTIVIPMPSVGPTGTLRVLCRPSCDIQMDGQGVGKDDITLSTATGQHNLTLVGPDGRNFRAMKAVSAEADTTFCYDFDARAFCDP